MVDRSPEQLRDALLAKMARRRSFSFTRDPNEVFVGTADDKGFELWMIPMGRNSWMPRCKGSFHAAGAATEVEVYMRLSPFVALFGWAWLGMVVFIGGLTALGTQHGDVWPGLIPLGMAAFFLVLSNASFAWAARGSEAALRETLAPGRFAG